MKLLTLAMLLCLAGCVKTVNQQELMDINVAKAQGRDVSGLWVKGGEMYYTGSAGKYTYFVHRWYDLGGEHVDRYRTTLAYIGGDRFDRTLDESKWKLVPAEQLGFLKALDPDSYASVQRSLERQRQQ